MPSARVGVVGVGSFGLNHLRVIHHSENAQLSGIFDIDQQRASEVASEYDCRTFRSLEELAKNSEAAIVASPTATHADIGCRLMQLGLDVLIEKPLAADLASGMALVETAERTGKLLHTGLLERFNPAILALEAEITVPLFFEVHRLSEFTKRSLDIDVVLDLMIHDIDVVLSLIGEEPETIRAAGISILTGKIDIANARLEFPSGCVANLTASRVHNERVRKLRVFQPNEYISLDYTQREAQRCRVKPTAQLDYKPLPVISDEPLRLELEAFFDSVVSRRPPKVTPQQALTALRVAHDILNAIEQHSKRVTQALRQPVIHLGGDRAPRP